MRAYVISFGVPLFIIALSVPLIRGAVSRNRLFGIRPRRTLAPDEAWYPANRIGGIALVVSSLVWLAAGTLLVGEPDGEQSVMAIGLIATAVAMIGATAYAAAKSP